MKGLYVLKEKRIYKRELPLWGSLLAAVLLAGCITLLALWCQPNALRTVLAGFKAQPLLIVLNALPIGLLLLAFAFLFRNVFYSGALVNFFVCALSLANRVKIEVRDEPVFPRDFSLLREVGSAIQSYDIRYPVKAIAVVVLTTVLLIGLGVLFPSRPVSFATLKAKLTKRDAVAVFPGRCWPERIVGAVLSFGVLTALIFTVYASNTLYNSFRVSNAYYVPSVFNELGFPYCFCHQFTTYPVDKPEGFSKSEAAGWETGGQTGLGKDVSVILVMNEAFSDLTDQSMFNWTEETDPLPNLHALQKDPHALSGHIVVPGFAGGTANTEFDALTGMQTNALSVTATSAMRVVNRNLDSLFRVFGADGYRTSFYHPGDAWFYNRENVYRWLGAEHEVFAKDMKNLEYKGRWVTDDYMAGLIEEEFETAVSEGRPLFNYTTTIQNHMSYTADKYGEGYIFPPVSTTADISPETRSMLEVYTEGVRDADAMLGRLTEYFAEREEPVVLVFYGDHLPYLGDNQKGYAELGSEVSIPENEREDILCSYKTPYVLWANDAATDALNWNEAVAALDLPEDGVLSASFLGSVLLDLTGRAGESPWFDFLSSLRRIAPVVQKKTYILADGSVLPQRILNEQTDEASMELKAAVHKWRCWSYYKLKYADVG
jgi:arylsulfatase